MKSSWVVLGPKRLVAAGAGVALASVSMWGWWVHRHPDQLWSMIDLQVLHWGGHLVRHESAELYEARYRGVLPFFYPPFSGLALAALNMLPLSVLKLLQALLSIGSVFAVSWLTLGVAARRRAEPLSWPTRLAATGALGAVAMWLEPVQQTLRFGQLSAALLLMVVADLSLADRRWCKGALIGLAAGLKLYPGAFIGYLLITGRVRAALVASGSLLTTMAIGHAFRPDLSARFWSPAGLDSLSTRVDASDLMNQSLNGYLLRVTMASEASRQYWLTATLAVVALGMALAVVLHRRYGEPAGMLVTALTSLLAAPISWDHYWIWVVPALVWASYEMWARRAVWCASLLLCVVALFVAYPLRVDPVTGGWDDDVPLLPLGILWLVPQEGQREFGWDPGQQVIGNLYVILGMTALALTTVWFLSTRLLATRLGTADGRRPTPVAGTAPDRPETGPARRAGAESGQHESHPLNPTKPRRRNMS